MMSSFRMAAVRRIAALASALAISVPLGAADPAVPVPGAPTMTVPAATPSSEFTLPLVAVVPFAGAEGYEDVAQIIEADLVRSGSVSAFARAGQPARPSQSKELDFEPWSRAGVSRMVIGSVAPGAGGVVVRFWVLDVTQQRQLLGFEMPASDPAQLRYTAHQIADLVSEKLTGTPGLANTKIAYVASTGVGLDRKNALTIVDADGFNARVVAMTRESILSPAWSPDRRSLAYVGFEKGQSAIYVQQIATGKVRKLVAEKGINGSPAWSPDGTRIAMTLSLDAQNPDIHVVDVASGRRQRVTDAPGIDTEPAWSPDGQFLLFTSERGGTPQIYRVAATGGEAVQLSRTGAQNYRASYSPDGRYVVMANRDEGRFRIGVLEVATGTFRRVSEGRLDVSPAWAPNGQAIVYSTRGARGEELAFVRFDGRAIAWPGLPTEAREPAWSPIQRWAP